MLKALNEVIDEMRSRYGRFSGEEDTVWNHVYSLFPEDDWRHLLDNIPLDIQKTLCNVFVVDNMMRIHYTDAEVNRDIECIKKRTIKGDDIDGE